MVAGLELLCLLVDTCYVLVGVTIDLVFVIFVLLLLVFGVSVCGHYVWVLQGSVYS